MQEPKISAKRQITVWISTRSLKETRVRSFRLTHVVLKAFLKQGSLSHGNYKQGY